MVFPGLMAMSVVRWIVGDLEVLQDQHLVPGTREHLHKALALQTRRLFNLTSSLSSCFSSLDKYKLTGR